MKPSLNASRVPPIPRCVDFDEPAYNKLLHDWGVETGPRGWPRLYWALRAFANHGWTIEQAKAFVQYSRLPAPDELQPARVILWEEKEAPMQLGHPLLKELYLDDLPYPAVRLLYGYRFTHYSTSPSRRAPFLRKMARFLGPKSVEGLCYEWADGTIVIQQPTVLVYPVGNELGAHGRPHRLLFGVRIIRYEADGCEHSKTSTTSVESP